MTYKWRTNPEIIARLIETASISSFRSKDIVLEPTESLTILQDGKIVDTYTEQRMKNIVGGIGKKLFFGQKSIRIDRRTFSHGIWRFGS